MRLPEDPEKLKLLTREYILKHSRELEKKLDTFKKQLQDGSLVEKLAELEHKQWAHWIKHQLKELSGDEWECVKKWTKWKKQSETSYSNLSEKEKKSDRDWARKVLELLGERVK